MSYLIWKRSQNLDFFENDVLFNYKNCNIFQFFENPKKKNLSFFFFNHFFFSILENFSHFFCLVVSTKNRVFWHFLVISTNRIHWKKVKITVFSSNLWVKILFENGYISLIFIVVLLSALKYVIKNKSSALFHK